MRPSRGSREEPSLMAGRDQLANPEQLLRRVYADLVDGAL
jgi:hypothetical protein